MPTLESLKQRLDDIETEISELRYESNEIYDKIEIYREAEKLEPFVITALNKNYNRWCSHAYLQQTILWDEVNLDPDDEDSIKKIIAACEILVEKGIVQQKETGSYDDDLEPICDYRITDTETIDMFDRR